MSDGTRHVYVSQSSGVQVGDGNTQIINHYHGADGAASKRGPAGGTWAVAVSGDEHSGAVGGGVVIGARRVLTCARVCAGLTGADGSPKVPLWVRFPRTSPPDRDAAGSRAPSRRVVGVQLPEDECGLAVLLLEGAVPEGVRAAPLRRPVPDDLHGLAWWAFGFPVGQPRGDEAYGTVGVALADGCVRLGVSPGCRTETGFSGSGLWSPDYEAVVGIIDTEPAGGALAVTLYQADRCFGAEGLAGAGRWPAEQAGAEAMSSWGWALRDDPEYESHWRPRARGVNTDGEGVNLFRGRREALTTITGWLSRDHADGKALVVTGSPGVGKSAVLGRVVTTADPVLSSELPASDDAVRAAAGSVSCAVHAKGKTALEVATEIARAASARLPSRMSKWEDGLAPAIRAALAVHGIGRFNVVIDALDEAQHPDAARRIVRQVVRPLLGCAGIGVQVVIGTRRRDDHGSLIEAFGDPAVLIDLDAEQYFALEDLEAYALATLLQAAADRPESPYATEQAARPLAKRIAAMSGTSFLVAYLTANAHGRYDDEPVDPNTLAYPLDVENTLGEYLDKIPQLGLTDGASVSARRLLTALAYAEAPGLPVELWMTAIEGLYGLRIPDIVLEEFAQSSAANFLVETSQDDQMEISQDYQWVFRLYHQALNDTLLRPRARNARRDQGRLTRALIGYGRGDGWAKAPRYLRRSLSGHAQAAGMLGELLADDGYLLHADLQRLTPQAAQATPDVDGQRARLLRFTPYAASTEDPRKRRALFSVTETLEKLGGSFSSSPGTAPYRARWSTATTHAERASQVGHAGGVWTVHAFVSEGQTLLASAGEDEMVRIWDPVAGRQLRVLEGHSGVVSEVCAFDSADGRTLLASAGTDATLLIWDPATGQQEYAMEGREGHTGDIWSVCAFDSADGRTLLASAGADATLLIWDPATGRRVQSLEGHGAPVNAVCAFTVDGRARLATAGNDGTVVIWDPDARCQERRLEGHQAPVNAVCAFTVDGRARLATAGSDTMAAVWDPLTGTKEREFNAHTEGAVWSVCAVTADDGGNRVLLASVGDDAAVRVWDPATGQQQYALEGVTSAVWAVFPFTVNGQSLLATGENDPVVRVWDLATRQQLHALKGGGGSVWSMCQFTSADDRILLASAGDDGMVQIYDPETGRRRLAVVGVRDTPWQRTAPAGSRRPRQHDPDMGSGHRAVA